MRSDRTRVLGAICVLGLSACGGGGGSADPDGGTTTVINVDASGVSPGSVRMIVPAYFPPGPQWQRVIAAAPTVGMVIVNPASGPGTTTDPQLTQVIAQARTAGIIVLGYVATSYGQRPVADVIADVNGYADLYSLSGIYLAEGPMEADCSSLETQYQNVVAAAHARDANAIMAVGTHYCPTYVTFVDYMVEFAMSWSDYQSYVVPTWMPSGSRERFVHFISDVPPSDAGAAISRAIANGAGWVFATDQSEPNPWGQLPVYFDQELQAIRTLAP
jgi:hypothetical protein